MRLDARRVAFVGGESGIFAILGVGSIKYWSPVGCLAKLLGYHGDLRKTEPKDPSLQQI